MSHRKHSKTPQGEEPKFDAEEERLCNNTESWRQIAEKHSSLFHRDAVIIDAWLCCCLCNATFNSRSSKSPWKRSRSKLSLFKSVFGFYVSKHATIIRAVKVKPAPALTNQRLSWGVLERATHAWRDRGIVVKNHTTSVTVWLNTLFPADRLHKSLQALVYRRNLDGIFNSKCQHLTCGSKYCTFFQVITVKAKILNVVLNVSVVSLFLHTVFRT